MSFATSSAGAFDLTAVNGNKIITPVTAQNGPILCYPGVPHKSTDINNPLALYVTTGANDALNVFGYVLRYYPKENTDPSLGYSPE